MWIERAFDPDRIYNEYFPDQFVLYQEQRVASPPAAAPFFFRALCEIPLIVTKPIVVDSVGNELVAIS